MTPEEQKKKTELEQQLNNGFFQLQQEISNLKNEVQAETDEIKKQEKNKKIQEIEGELNDIGISKERLERTTTFQSQDTESLITRIESLRNSIKGDLNNLAKEVLQSNKKTETPKTYELLEGSETHARLLNIISSNPKKFKDLKDEKGNELETPEKKLEYIFKKIRDSIVQFMKNKLGDFEKSKEVIDNTIAPAFEWNLMELLRDQGNEANTEMLQELNGISWGSFKNLFNGIKGFASKCSSSYNKFNQWMNALDYLSIHKGILDSPERSEVLTNPLKFQEYLNNAKFSSNGFDPYSSFSNDENKQLFKIDKNQSFEFGISPDEKQKILSKIGNIQVVNNPKTTALITKMINKPEQFLKNTPALQRTANTLLNGLNAVNGVTKVFGIDIIGEITEPPENRSFLYRILDFVCKLIGFTGGIEGIVKNWRLDRLKLDNQKKDNIKLIYEKFKEKNLSNKEISISDLSSCEEILKEFELTDLDKNSPSTRGDFLCLSIANNINLSLVSPSTVQELMGSKYIKTEETNINGKKQMKKSVDISKFSNDDKKIFAFKHINSMREHFKGNYNKLTDFFQNIHSFDDITICMTTALYTSRNDIIEGIKAKVFLPENYGVTIESTSAGGGENGGKTQGNGESTQGNGGGEKLDSNESSDKQMVNEKWVYDKAREFGVTDNRQIAYILSTIKGESGFKNQKEIGGEKRSYGKIDPATGKAYYGRGFIQITHKGNYQAYTKIIKDSGKDFKDNNGNIIKGSEIDLVQNPDIILESNDLAIFIAIDWMKNGGPSRQNNKRLDYYINNTKQDYHNARIIINGMSSNPRGYADTAQAYLNKLGTSS